MNRVIEVHTKEEGETRVVSMDEIDSYAPFRAGHESWCVLFLTDKRKLVISECYEQLVRKMNKPINVN